MSRACAPGLSLQVAREAQSCRSCGYLKRRKCLLRMRCHEELTPSADTRSRTRRALHRAVSGARRDCRSHMDSEERVVVGAVSIEPISARDSCQHRVGAALDVPALKSCNFTVRCAVLLHFSLDMLQCDITARHRILHCLMGIPARDSAQGN